MRGLGLHTLEPTEPLGPMPGAFGQASSTKIGTIPFYGIAVIVPAAGAALAGACVAGPRKRWRGAAYGGIGGAVGGLTAILLLKALS